MELILKTEFTLSDLSPGWTEDFSGTCRKASLRPHGSMQMSLLRVGRSPEHSRKYIPGDQVALIDWKAFARTDSLIVREQRDEASARIVFVVDCGSSMHWPSPADRENLNPSERVIITKSDLAIRIAFWLMHSHLVSGDSVEIWLRIAADLPGLKWRPKSSSELMSVFSSSTSSLHDKIKSYFVEATWSHPRSDLIWVLSDGIEEWSFESLAENSRKLQLVHVLSSLEVNVDWMDDDTCYLVTKPTSKDYLGKQLKQGGSYLQNLEKWRAKIQNSVKRINGDYFFATDKTSVSLLIQFLHLGGADK